MTNHFLADELPTKNVHIVGAIGAVLIVCAFLYWLNIRFLVDFEVLNPESPWKAHAEVARSVVENLIAGSIAAILLALTFKWIIQIIDPRDRVLEINSSNITDRLIKNAQTTRNYIFIGNTASFVSASILPVLSDSIRITGQPRTATLILIDPTYEDAVKSYSNFKQGILQSASKTADLNLARWVPPASDIKIESTLEVQAKVLSAIYLACYSSMQSGFSLNVYLRKTFTPFRADMSDTEIVLTQESADQSAVAFSSSGHFYGWYHKEADAQRMQSVKIDIDGQQIQTRLIGLAHPSRSKEEIQKSVHLMLQQFPHIASLASDAELVNKTASRISRPSSSYSV
ncbi:MAG: hypothetical protein ACK41V_22135 [Acidovorax sp.]|uniref:hypothetical protein n=1 Tax=Acidovorax sp. TaxID=1872122 RepID=UPI00391D1C22